MKTRTASRAAVAAAATTRNRVASAVTPLMVTPSPPRKKKPKSTHQSMSSEQDIREEMRKLVLSRVTIPSGGNTDTLGGWCLVDGLAHCAIASNGILLPLIKEHCPPDFYIDQINNKHASTSSEEEEDGYKSFRSLCRIVSGQQLAGSAARTIWRRLLNVVDATEEDTTNLTPESILSIVDGGNIEEDLRSPAGLSNSKCNCIISIANNYRGGNLSDDILLGGEATTDDEVRTRLLSIKGLGPWSVDMFLLFQCHRSDILPIGDLAFRNGTANLWEVRGKAKGGGLCERRDKEVMRELHSAFTPYRSISSYYMYKCSGMK